ncbi:MAG: hypothetical protein RLY16_3030 [Bacteroidota bacterium]|jgi:hypothetical protein
MMTYKTSLDNLAKGVTLGVTILFFVIIAGQYSSSVTEGKSPFIFSTMLLSLIYLGTFLFRPIRYSITDEKLIIHRPLLDIKIDRTTIEKVEQLENDQLSCAVRIFGVGGLFGYWGKFSNSKIGSMTWYATRRSNAVLVTTIHNKKIVLTPNEPEKFVTEFNRQTL